MESTLKLLYLDIKNSTGDLAINKRKENQGWPPNLSVGLKQNIMFQTKILQEKMGNFCVKRIQVRAGIPTSYSGEIIRRILKSGWIKVETCTEERSA